MDDNSPTSLTDTAAEAIRAEERSEWGFRLLAAMKVFTAEAVERDLFCDAEFIHLAIIKVAALHLLSCAELPDELETCARIVQRAFRSAVDDMEAQRSVH
jgi:hypothetical protein